MNNDAPIFVAGHRGLVGSAIWRELTRLGFTKLIGRTRAELDLLDTAAVRRFYAEEKPAYVFVAAAKVGGIHANDSLPAEFLYENLQIQNNLIHGAHLQGVKKLLFLGSSCIYPRLAAQPLREDSLLTGPLEPTNQWYAAAKIAGIMLCQAYRKQYGFDAISLMPTNLYGPGDNFHAENSHVLPALLRRFHEAKLSGASDVEIWGTGEPRREFLHVDDLADAAVFLMNSYCDPEIINVGTGTDVSIRELAELIQEVVGYRGSIRFDTSRPDGTPRKLLDVSRLQELGWQPKIALRDGIATTYRWFLDNQSQLRGVEAGEPAAV